MVQPGYAMLPRYYDRWQQSYGNDYSTLILPRLLSAIRRHRIPQGAMLDLACGTGTLGLMLARKGWIVWGIDGSEGMLAEARAKAENRGLPINLLRQDMRVFTLPEKVVLVTCLFDSLNHLPSVRALRSTFRSVSQALEPGGYFIFDVNNELCFKTLWEGSDTIRCKGFTLHLDMEYDVAARRAAAKVTVTEAGGAVRRETVHERCFTPDQLSTALRDANFNVRESVDFNFSDAGGVGKVKTWWVARRV